MSGDEINTKYTYRLSSWHFKPTLKLSLISITLITILVYLGAWQTNRATQKKIIYNIVQQKSLNPPVALSAINQPNLLQNRFTNVIIHATFLNQFTFLLDNQMHQHHAGYKVITAAQLAGCQRWLLIDRGWIAAGANRKILPKIEPIYEAQQLMGIINTIPSGIVLHRDKIALSQPAPYLIQKLDYRLIGNLLSHPIFDFVVQLRSNSMTPYTITDLNFGISSSKHLGYALQWYLFAILVLVYYLIGTIKKGR